MRAMFGSAALSDDWAVYSKVNHRLPLCDGPSEDGSWTIAELAEEFGCTVRWMASVMRRMVQNRDALRIGQRYYPS